MSQPTAPFFSMERVMVEAAGYGILYGGDPSLWPEFALRAMESWVARLGGHPRIHTSIHVRDAP